MREQRRREDKWARDDGLELEAIGRRQRVRSRCEPGHIMVPSPSSATSTSGTNMFWRSEGLE